MAKEIALRLQDRIADFISDTALQLGLTSEELIKYILGSWARDEQYQQAGPMASSWRFIQQQLSRQGNEMLKTAASMGILSCKNCTMKIKPEDVDKGECSSCHAPISSMFGPQTEGSGGG